MGSWDRYNPIARQRLLPFVVPMGRQGWYTVSEMYSTFGSRDRMDRHGYDAGGHIFLDRRWQEAVLEISTLQAYSLQRRALRQAYGGNDFFGKIIQFQPGDAFNPNDHQTISDDHVGDLYDICISFHTALEAVTFRMMVQGVVEPT